MVLTLDAVYEAHGGLPYWSQLSALELTMSVKGLLFTAKRITPLIQAHLTVDTRVPRVVLHDFPTPGHSAVFDGARGVEVRDTGGRMLQARARPREAFGSWRRTLRWDVLDFTYFCGYAMWNYMTLPFLLDNPAVRVTAVGQESATGVTRVRAEFPSTLPTHSATQDFYFERSGRLLRHDYTAEVVGPWARAAHLCGSYRQFGGLWVPTRRRVYPRGPRRHPLPRPTLVAIDIHDVRPVASAGASPVSRGDPPNRW